MPPEKKVFNMPIVTERKPAKYVMPTPPSVVVWRSSAGDDPCNAVVTRPGKTGISVMLFPPESRACVPKDGVRYIGDPQNKIHTDSSSGVWDYTNEHKALMNLLAERDSYSNDGK